jgi:hypothetical protein
MINENKNKWNNNKFIENFKNFKDFLYKFKKSFEVYFFGWDFLNFN